MLGTPTDVRSEWRWVVIGLIGAAAVLAVQLVAGLTREALSDDPSHLELVQTCLTERSTPFEQVVGDAVAASAGRGALRTTVDGNGVTVSLGSSEEDAERMFDSYVAVAPEDIAGTRLQQNRKVVFLWDAPPNQAQHDFLVLCTLDAQN